VAADEATVDRPILRRELTRVLERVREMARILLAAGRVGGGDTLKGLTFFIFKKSKIFLLLYLKEQLLENIFPNFHRDSSSRKKVTALLTARIN